MTDMLAKEGAKQIISFVGGFLPLKLLFIFVTTFRCAFPSISKVDSFYSPLLKVM